MVKSMKILPTMDRRLAVYGKRREGASHSKTSRKKRSVRIDFRTNCPLWGKVLGSARRLRIAFSPLVKYHAGGVSKVILTAFIVICILALYFYAHYNWHPLPAGTTIDRILVEKSAKRLSIFRDGNQVKRYRIALGRNPVAAKQEEGDMKTPEGMYQIDSRNAQSSFHLALHISYPSDEDNQRAAARGISAGSDIMIHGIQNGRGWIGAFHRWKNWTAGCIALTDEEIEELWRVTPDGTTIEIRP
jgi:lipoprotein-anchoring transpeptidase ErfK/SrfK